MRMLIAASLLVAVSACDDAIDASSADRHNPTSTVPAEAKNATRLVIYDLARTRSASARTARQSCEGYCDDGGGSIEMAIGLLGVGGNATTDSLLDLLAVQLDTDAKESLSCEIAKRGKSLVSALRGFDPAKASRWCEDTFDSLRLRELSKVKDVTVQQICRPEVAIEADRNQWVEALGSGQDLFAESGPC